MNVFEKITELFQSIEQSVIAANQLDKAYADGVNHPEYHTPFTLESNPQMVAMNLAGLYAADTAANILSLVNFDDDSSSKEELYLICLNKIYNQFLTPAQEIIVKNIANVTWRTGQPFRDITSNPLNRITRSVNMQFNLLPEDEEKKDMIQICTGAGIILNYINS